ncbi:MAG: glycosyltransferase [Salinarimonadaceae bacterium]|nr:MAG: glycosyltransferase [Salinarimonadaceae bacterium]
MLYLNEIQTSLVHVALAIGATQILTALIDRRNLWHRALLLGIGGILALRYAWWRATETLAPFGPTWDFAASWSLFALEMAALAGALSAALIMTRHSDRSGEVDANLAWWRPGPAPRVAVLIATYNEDREIIERTIVGARSLDYPSVDVLVLDDGRRDWLRDYCVEHDVKYLRRTDNKGSKAGNINNALAALAADPPDFIAVLDADFVPHSDFLTRTLPLFHDPQVGLVQTPQHFFNADPVQHNLGLTRSYPDEQRFFFDHMQPARDGWGIAFCCGTSSVARWRAVQEAGLFPTDSITEDFMLTLTLRDAGWATVYLNEPLTEGLAPEGLKEYVTQRTRWCLGMMQIARSRVGPLARNNLRLRDRWSIADSLFYWLTTFPFRIAALIYPLFYWFFSITVVDARLPDVLSFFGVYYIWTMMALNLLTRGMVAPIINDVSQLVCAIPVSRAAIVGLIKPKGHPFTVTAKGGDRRRVIVQWGMMAPWLTLLALTLIGLLLGIFLDRFAYFDAGDGKVVVLFWSLYNVVVLSVAILACIELPRRESHVADQPERAVFNGPGGLKRLWIAAMTLETVRVRGLRYPKGAAGVIRLRDVGDVAATVVSQTPDGATMRIFPDGAQRHALLRRFYTEGNAPGVVSISIGRLLEDIGRRLSFRPDRRRR